MRRGQLILWRLPGFTGRLPHGGPQQQLVKRKRGDRGGPRLQPGSAARCVRVGLRVCFFHGGGAGRAAHAAAGAVAARAAAGGLAARQGAAGQCICVSQQDGLHAGAPRAGAPSSGSRHCSAESRRHGTADQEQLHASCSQAPARAAAPRSTVQGRGSCRCVSKARAGQGGWSPSELEIGHHAWLPVHRMLVGSCGAKISTDTGDMQQAVRLSDCLEDAVSVR
mmetsp:Transcript_28839/g.73558  ORF Transcript_28839/g.73558 Transcript_28839/m.73558 type:complete len:223 (+) Transcript_28839:894-1562(+)